MNLGSDLKWGDWLYLFNPNFGGKSFYVCGGGRVLWGTVYQPFTNGLSQLHRLQEKPKPLGKLKPVRNGKGKVARPLKNWNCLGKGRGMHVIMCSDNRGCGQTFSKLGGHLSLCECMQAEGPRATATGHRRVLSPSLFSLSSLPLPLSASETQKSS